MALGGALCALLVVLLAGETASCDARERRDVPGSTRVSKARPALAGAQKRLVEDQEPPLQGALELPRAPFKPVPGTKRFETRPGLAPRSLAWVASVARTAPERVPAERHGRIADRPLIANCPARGPPRTA